jgi:LPXTG-motif cell wall-anchored protein
MKTSRTALLAVVAAAGLILAAASPAVADTTTTPSPAAAGWLARQLIDGERLQTVYSGTAYDDTGLTIDGLLAFASAGVSGDAAAKALHWLTTPANAEGYYGEGDNDPTTAAAGSLGKLIVALQVAGEDPTALNGTDLVALLLSLQDSTTGRFLEKGPYGDYSNAISESFAEIALARTGAHPTQTAAGADYLGSLQCADGGWPLDLASTPTKCDSQVDATAYVVQALLAAGRTEAAGEGLDWLVSKQKSNGGFGDEADNPSPLNANSTGVAAQALKAGGRTASATAATTFLLSLQVGCDGPEQQRGAFAFDASGFNAGSATRATAQAILGFGGVSLATLSLGEAQADAPTLDCPAAPASAPVPAAPELPKTGSPVASVLTIGAVLVVAGTALLVITRLRRRPTAE